MTPQPDDGVGGRLRHRAAAQLVAAALRADRDIRLRVWGTSMIPAIWPGDVVLVSPSRRAPLASGAIVLFLRRGRLFAHRIVDRGADYLITRGDALADCDPPVAVTEALGVVTAIICADGASRALRTVAPLPHRLIAFAIRHWGLGRGAALKWHRLLRRAVPSPFPKDEGIRVR